MTPPSSRPTPRFTFVILGLLLLSGLGFRVAGSDWGFPLLAHTDEPLVTRDASRLAIEGGWEPSVFDHPGHFSIYANTLLDRGVFAFSGQAPTHAFFQHNITTFYHWSRLLCAGWSTLLILVAFLIGREFSPWQGLAAAAMVTFFPSFIEHAYYITPDVPLTLLVALNTLFCLRYIKTGNVRHLVAATVAAALALTEKYPGALAVLVIGAGILANERLSRDEKLGTGVRMAALYLAVAFAASPYLFLHFDRVVEAVLIEARPVHLGADGLGFAGNLGFYLEHYARRAGWVLTLFAIPGCIVIWRTAARSAILLLGGGFLYLIFLSTLGLHWERWALPCYFLLIQATAAGLVWCVEAAKERRAVLRWGLALVLAPAGASLALQALYLAVSFQLPDTRSVALSFCRERNITSLNSAYEDYTPFAVTQHLIWVPRRHGGFKRIAPQPETLEHFGRRYIILSSYMYDRYEAEPRRYARALAAYAAIRSTPLVARFDSETIVEANRYALSPFSSVAIVDLIGRLNRIAHHFSCSGPVIEIYDLGAGPRSPVNATRDHRIRHVLRGLAS